MITSTRRSASLLPVLGAFVTAAWLGTTAVQAADCPGNPDALGTSRTIVVDPTEHPRIGTMQYSETLPLEDHEVVLTFDDGPLPAHTNPILDILAAQCVKATFFMVGSMARAFPQDVRRVEEAGHTIGTHSQSHPFRFGAMPADRITSEVEDGITNVGAALGDPSKVAPFFRIPGLRRSAAAEAYLAQRGIMIWSADFPADDWRHISSAQVTQLALSRLEAKGKGILLLHDIQARTEAALPVILQQLKARGYRVVHVVAATPERPKTVTEPGQWVPHWVRGPGPIAKAPVPGFAFGTAENPARGNASPAQSVWLARVPVRPRTSALPHRMPARAVFQTHDKFEPEGGKASKLTSLARLPVHPSGKAGNIAPRPPAAPIKTGSRAEVPVVRTIQ